MTIANVIYIESPIFDSLLRVCIFGFLLVSPDQVGPESTS